MNQAWKLHIWGTRGSMPVSCADYLEYGGNTSCVSVDCGRNYVVFDAGSGLFLLGGCLPPGSRVDLFCGHAHLDHLMGLPVFRLMHDPSAELHLYGEPRKGVSFRQQLETLIGPPYWPLELSDFRAHITVHDIGPGQSIPLPDGKTVRTMRACHPNLGLLFRLDDGTRSVVYTVDCEITAPLQERLADFAQGADVLVWDATFTPEELPERRGWGHSSWAEGAELRRVAQAKLAIMMHYANGYTDDFLTGQERLAAAHDPAVRFAREGMEVTI